MPEAEDWVVSVAAYERGSTRRFDYRAVRENASRSTSRSIWAIGIRIFLWL